MRFILIAAACGLTLSARAEFVRPSRLTVIRAAGVTALLGGSAMIVTTVVSLRTLDHPDVRLLGLRQRLIAAQAAIEEAETLTGVPDKQGLVESLRYERHELLELMAKHGLNENRAPTPAELAEIRKRFVAQAQSTNSTLIRRVVNATGGAILMFGGLAVVLASDSLDHKLAATDPERALAEAGVDRDDVVARAIASHEVRKEMLE